MMGMRQRARPAPLAVAIRRIMRKHGFPEPIARTRALEARWEARLHG